MIGIFVAYCVVTALISYVTAFVAIELDIRYEDINWKRFLLLCLTCGPVFWIAVLGLLWFYAVFNIWKLLE